MSGQFLSSSNYKLDNVLSSAGATIGIIISGTIFLQFLSSKYLDLAGRYRELAQEYRQGGANNSRHGQLQRELRLFHRRLRMMMRASWLAALALLSFMTAVLTCDISLVYPDLTFLRDVGASGLFLGLILMAAAVLFELVQSIAGRRELAHETGDLDPAAKQVNSAG